MYQILLGVQQCHVNNNVHCNLNMSNILYERYSNSVKIAGFRLVCDFSTNANYSKIDVQNFQYTAPAVLLGRNNYSHAIDMWSIGCILLGQPMLSGDFGLLKKGTAIEQLLTIFQKLGTPTEESWPGRWEFHD